MNPKDGQKRNARLTTLANILSDKYGIRRLPLQSNLNAVFERFDKLYEKVYNIAEIEIKQKKSKIIQKNIRGYLSRKNSDDVKYSGKQLKLTSVKKGNNTGGAEETKGGEGKIDEFIFPPNPPDPYTSPTKRSKEDLKVDEDLLKSPPLSQTKINNATNLKKANYIDNYYFQNPTWQGKCFYNLAWLL